MINEKPNNNIDWKDKLDELESLAGEKFNKEVSWEKLHARLQSKPKTKKMIWYWLFVPREQVKPTQQWL